MTTTPSDIDLEKAREIARSKQAFDFGWGYSPEGLEKLVAQALSELRAEMQGRLDAAEINAQAVIKRADMWQARAEAAESALSQRADEIATALIESAQGHEHLKGLASKDGDRESALVHSSNAAILRLEAQAIRTRYAREG